MKKFLLVYLVCFAGFAHGQQNYVQSLKSNNQDIFQRNLYSADHVMELRSELKLTEAQATNIKKIHSENTGKFSTVKWDLDEETKKLKALLDETKIDQVAVQKQMDKVLALENSLKKQQLSTMVSIKNELNQEQQEILQSQRLETLNGVRVIGYGKNSAIPLAGVAGTGSTSSPKLAVTLSGTPNSEYAPLYYVDTKDGMKQLKTLSNIDANDVESIEVLKDKAAIELYGEKAKNGVVIVKLKNVPKK